MPLITAPDGTPEFDAQLAELAVADWERARGMTMPSSYDIGVAALAEALARRNRPRGALLLREALGMIREAGGIPAGIVIALDRQERVREDAAGSAAQSVAAEHGIGVVAVAGLGDLLAFTGERAELGRHRDALLAYRARYGIT